MGNVPDDMDWFRDFMATMDLAQMEPEIKAELIIDPELLDYLMGELADVPGG